MIPSIQGYLIAGALALFVGLGGGGYVAWELQAVKIADMKLADAQAVNDAWKLGWLRRDAQEAVTVKANNSNANTQAAIAANTQGVIQYVPKYITVHDNAACPLPAGFSRLLDAAITGQSPADLPDDAGKSIGTATGPSLSEATAVLAQDLGDYFATRARVLNARDAWSGAAAAAVAKPPDKPSFWQRNNPF